LSQFVHHLVAPIIRRYVQPFYHNIGTWQTDRQTNGMV